MRIVLCLALLLLSACAGSDKGGVTLTPVPFADLPGWQDDDVTAAQPAFERSCAVMKKAAACQAFVTARGKSGFSFRTFVEQTFRPMQVSDGGNEQGLFTGYYEPLLKGSLKKTARYHVPLYGVPDDLVTVDLGLFKPDLKGQSVTGQLHDRKLKPYPVRAEIVEKGLRKQANVLAWVDDPVDVFFLEIQGSGRVQLTNGKTLRLGYAGKNGRAYSAVGKVLKDKQRLGGKITMPMIRDWLADNHEIAQDMMNENASYVFFRVTKGDGPIGAQGVALTALRSLAVDPKSVSLGSLVWLDMADPETDTRWRRLMVAQDTGGAIKGAVRGDVFTGFGPRAAELAGMLQSRGTYYVLQSKGAP